MSLSPRATTEAEDRKSLIVSSSSETKLPVRRRQGKTRNLIIWNMTNSYWRIISIRWYAPIIDTYRECQNRLNGKRSRRAFQSKFMGNRLTNSNCFLAPENHRFIAHLLLDNEHEKIGQRMRRRTTNKETRKRAVVSPHSFIKIIINILYKCNTSKWTRSYLHPEQHWTLNICLLICLLVCLAVDDVGNISIGAIITL